MKKFVYALAAMTVAASAVSAEKIGSSQSSEESAPLDTNKVVALQDVQVVSIRASKKTPMAFTNVSKAQIKELNYGKDIPQLLQMTPSVTVSSDAGNGIGYTTMRVRGTDPSRINVTANGVPMNDAESASLFWVNFSDFASSAQSMQIQRGVGTSTNGAGAFGATLNMQTENIGTQPYVGLDMSAGSYYSHKETLRFGTGLIKDHWGIQGRLSNIGSKGYLDRASTKLNSYFLQAGYFGDNTVVKFITFNGEEQTYHAWNYASKYEQSLYGRRYNSCGMYYDKEGNMCYYDGQTDNYHSNNFQLILNQRLGEFFNLNAALHYTRGDGYYEEYIAKNEDYGYGNLQDYGLSTTTVYSDLTRQQKMANDFYGAIASLNYNDKKGLAACLGGGWNLYDGDNFGKVLWVKDPVAVGASNFVREMYPNLTYYDANARKADFNIYGKVNYEIVKGLNGYVDLQYRYVKYRLQDPRKLYGVNNGEYILDNRFNFFNPKFGLNYDITPNHKVYASYAISHKEPVRNNYTTWMNDQSQSYPTQERLNDLELGYKYQSQRFSAGVNFYWMDYKDQFVLTGALNEIGEALTANLPNSYRVGVELEAAWKPVDWFQWDLNGTWSRNRVKNIAVTLCDGTSYTIDGETPLSFSPDWIFNNIFTFKYKGFKGSIQSQYISEQYLNNTGFKSYETTDVAGNPCNVGMMLDGHFTTNVNLDYTFQMKKFGMKDITVGFAFYNIFSAEYDNNGWSSCTYTVDNGKLKATGWTANDQGEAGFAPSAPFNFMGHVSINF